jgi:hypothetical protein
MLKTHTQPVGGFIAAMTAGADRGSSSAPAERQRAQERAKRRWAGIHPPSSRRGATGPEQPAVIDAVGAQRHRVDQRQHLTPAFDAAPRTPDAPSHRRDPRSASARERRGEHDPGVRDEPLVIKRDVHAVQSDGPAISLNQQGGLLTPGRGCAHSRKSPTQKVDLAATSDGSRPPARRIQAQLEGRGVPSHVKRRPDDVKHQGRL